MCLLHLFHSCCVKERQCSRAVLGNEISGAHWRGQQRCRDRGMHKTANQAALENCIFSFCITWLLQKGIRPDNFIATAASQCITLMYIAASPQSICAARGG